MNTKEFDILVCGEINPDLILYGDVEPVFGQVEKLLENAQLVIGSSSVIFACGAARLGLRVSFIGKCGEDVFGKFMIEKMQTSGIDTRYVIVEPDQSTGFSVILNKGFDRAILTYPGLISSLKVKDIKDEILSSTHHLHIASYFLQTNLQKGLSGLFQQARKLHLTISLDTNWDPYESWTGVNELLPYIDVFLPNEAEVCSLTGLRDLDNAIKELSNRVDTLVAKQGVLGAVAVCEGKKYFAKSLPVAVMDTVGAGDSFDAGFLYGYLKGWDLEKALQLGVICGSLSTQKIGGTDGQPSLDEAKAYLSNY